MLKMIGMRAKAPSPALSRIHRRIAALPTGERGIRSPASTSENPREDFPLPCGEGKSARTCDLSSAGEGAYAARAWRGSSGGRCCGRRTVTVVPGAGNSQWQFAAEALGQFFHDARPRPLPGCAWRSHSPGRRVTDDRTSLRNTGAIVAHDQLDEIGTAPQGDIDRRVRRTELDRIGAEVQQNLAERLFVGGNFGAIRLSTNSMEMRSPLAYSRSMRRAPPNASPA